MTTQTTDKLPNTDTAPNPTKAPWWKRTAGMFADQPMFDAVMKTMEEASEHEREEANRIADEAEADLEQALKS